MLAGGRARWRRSPRWSPTRSADPGARSRWPCSLALLARRPAGRPAPPAHCRTRSAPAPPPWSASAAVVLERVDGTTAGSSSRARSGPRAPTTRRASIEAGSHASRSCRSTARPPSSTNRRSDGVGLDRRSSSSRPSLLLMVLIALAKTVRIVPQARAGIVERLGRYTPHADAGPDDPGAVHRPAPAADRPARAGRLVPAAAGDHRGQPRRRASTRSSTSRSPTPRPRPTRSRTTSRRSSSSPSRRCATSSAAWTSRRR